MDKRVKIVTGDYRLADFRQRAMMRDLFGENAEHCYEIYFHWYNLIHELGHAIAMFNSPERPDPAEEEQKVNDFAVAYWRRFGEEEKLRDLGSIVECALSGLKAPSESGHMKYAKEKWGQADFYSFNNYGWFQFSCVKDALSRKECLSRTLSALGVRLAISEETMVLRYNEDENMARKVVADAVSTLRRWGVTLPEEVPVAFCDDLNCQMLADEE